MVPAAAPRRVRAIAGHPPGLLWLSLTQMWERFSYYGMRALLILYLTDQITRPGQMEQVVGFTALRSLLEHLFGPLSAQAVSSQIYGLYTALVYLMPLLGGVISDRWLERRTAVTAGALLIMAGHFLMVSEAAFLFALLFIVAGSGLFTPNISASVGTLYVPGDTRRERAYSLFYMAINLGGFLAPLVCGTVGEVFGWRYGFSIAGVGMAVGLATYLAGLRHIAPASPAAPQEGTGTRAPASSRATLVAVACCAILFWAALEQLGNALSLWVRDFVDLHPRGLFTLRVTWFQSFDSFFLLLLTPLLMLAWGRLARMGREPAIATKLAAGCFLMAAAYVVLGLAAMAGGRSDWLWTVLAIFLLTLGEMHFGPVSWSLFSHAAPPGREASYMGAWFVSLFLGSYLAGFMGSFWEQLGPSAYWFMIGAVALAGGLALAGVRALERR